MYIRRDIKWTLVILLAWKYVIGFALYSGTIVFIHDYCIHNNYDLDLTIPFLPISTIGIAVAFYIGFKNNQAYDRFWEGRKVWGGIVNYSRTWGNQVLSYIDNYHTTENYTAEEIHAIQELSLIHI